MAKRKNKKEDIKNTAITNIEPTENFSSKNEIEMLCELLEREKNIRIGSIAKKFNIDKKVAFEWCDILIENGIAELSFPLFGDPILKLIETQE